MVHWVCAYTYEVAVGSQPFLFIHKRWFKSHLRRTLCREHPSHDTFADVYIAEVLFGKFLTVYVERLSKEKSFCPDINRLIILEILLAKENIE